MSNTDNTFAPLSGTPSSGVRRGPVVPYVPGLDGLRALAVIAVIIYHANREWLGGGFLGVEVFFVISGYLITLLLIAERERTGAVSLTDFWVRRARRLLPALFTLLIGVITYCALFNRDRLGRLRGDVVGGFFYVSNWFQVWTGSSYTSSAEFAPLRHLWSLAVEEQFYIIWPLVMFLLLRNMRSRTLPVIGFFFTGLAAVIAVYTAVIFRTGPIDTIENTPEQFMSFFGREVLRTDFLYLGTVSRASGLLLGAALATAWRPWSIRRARAGANANGLDFLGILGLASLAYMCWKFRETVSTEAGTEGYALLYRGGLILVALATILVIATVTHPRSRLGKYVIGTPLLVWIGKRSYGLYLYHWVVFQAYRKSAGMPLEAREFIALMAITVVLTEASFQFIETPIRTGRALASYRAWRMRNGGVRGPLPIVLATLAIVPVFSVVSMAGARVMPEEVAGNLDENSGAVVTIPPTTVPVGTTTLPAVAPTTVPATKFDVFAVGDSVMLGSARKLTSYGITVDAAKNRQVSSGAQVLDYRNKTGELGDNVVIHLGTNGRTTASTFDQVMKPLSKVKRVIVLTVRVPGSAYSDKNNAIITALPLVYPNVTVLDWEALSKGKKDWFASDGIHPNALGQDNYVGLILKALGR
jgi:peptidoglycan/LPS O-acetylase OafA/YrhL/lysophospholipase L1-like esterase